MIDEEMKTEAITVDNENDSKLWSRKFILCTIGLVLCAATGVLAQDGAIAVAVIGGLVGITTTYVVGNVLQKGKQ